MAKNILKEAIADAKAVREVALSNAKAALEEAFTPKLQSMLSAKLSEELDEEMYDEDEDMDMDEMMNYDEDEDMEVEMDMDEMMNYDEDEDMDEDMYEEKGEEDSMDEEIDLEEILNELELEGDEEEEEADLEEAGGLNQSKPNYTADDVLPQHYTSKNIYEDSEFNLDALLNEINNLDEQCAPQQNMAPMQNQKPTYDELLQIVMSMRDEDFDNNMSMDMMETKGCGCTKENKELNETKSALTAVRDELNEVNLLNSKLLYVNRIFKANNLDEAQKLRVVETLDNASNIKEAKLIYETIKDTFTISKGNKTTPKKRSIREGLGMASKAAGMSTAPRKPILNESNDMVTRMQKLANISKIK